MRSFPIVFAVAVCFIAGCTSQRPDPLPNRAYDPEAIVIIPGECIRGPWIEYGNSFRVTGDYDGHLGFLIQLGLNVAIDSDLMADNTYRLFPRASVIESFGEDASQVKAAYEEIFNEYRARCGEKPDNALVSTVYYCGGLVITANKEFAGIPAGENLAPILHVFPDYLKESVPIPTIAVPDDYIPLQLNNPIKFWIDDHEIVDELVEFEVRMPVKIGMMLTLLRDRITNPSAEMQFTDEVLTGHFAIPRGLR